MRSCISRWFGWSSLAVALLIGAAGLSLACSTPTLPLPPPAALTYAGPDAEGFVTISGEVNPDAYVLCLNRNSDAGVIVRAGDDGRFECRLLAAPGDTIEVWQQIGTDRGPSLDIEITIPASPDAGM